MAMYARFNCSITGNPEPSIQWFRNGERLRFDPIVQYQERQLTIRTVEEEHMGIYQCVASNAEGEVQAVGQMSWDTRSSPPRPENVKCFPINYKTMRIAFDTRQKVSSAVERNL